MRGFSRTDRVGCVTGCVLSAELETEAQELFDAKAGWGSRYSPAALRPLLPALGRPAAAVPRRGRGRGRELRGLPGGPPAGRGLRRGPGAGTPSRGGEDLDYFSRVLLDGFVIAYEPSSVAWHYHRRTEEAIRRQMTGLRLRPRRLRDQAARRAPIPRRGRAPARPGPPPGSSRSRAGRSATPACRRGCGSPRRAAWWRARSPTSSRGARGPTARGERAMTRPGWCRSCLYHGIAPAEGDRFTVHPSEFRRHVAFFGRPARRGMASPTPDDARGLLSGRVAAAARGCSASPSTTGLPTPRRPWSPGRPRHPEHGLRRAELRRLPGHARGARP